tara:strand:- start:1006 stop:1134 length:129 start_codon:yes stop_codon:yes gene_type:complete
MSLEEGSVTAWRASSKALEKEGSDSPTTLRFKGYWFSSVSLN